MAPLLHPQPQQPLQPSELSTSPPPPRGSVGSWHVGSGQGNTPGQRMSEGGTPRLSCLHDSHTLLCLPASSSTGRHAHPLAFHLLIRPTFVGCHLWVRENPNLPGEQRQNNMSPTPAISMYRQENHQKTQRGHECMMTEGKCG